MNNTAIETTEKRNEKDLYNLHGHSENPGVQVVNITLKDNNYGQWSSNMMLALIAKSKLGFIDGTISAPPAEDAEYIQWMRADALVRAWIINSISSDLSGPFTYMKTARALWIAIEDKFREANGPLIFNLQREIVTLKQGDMSVLKYFNKLEHLWHELDSLLPPSNCGCLQGTNRESSTNTIKVVQFLMGLNDSYDAVRGQILLMTPMPAVSKIYNMVISVERQRGTQVITGDQTENSAMNAGRNAENKTGPQRGWIKKKENLYCPDCKKRGHNRESCFKTIGYPDWYLQLRDNKQGKTSANLADTPFDEGNSKDHEKEGWMREVARMIKTELSALTQSKGHAVAHFIYGEKFSGPEDA